MNIVVTGASRGLGFELVKSFAADSSNHIIAISRNKEKLFELKDVCEQASPECNIYPISFDLEDFDKYSDLSVEILGLVPQINILINNAGKLVNKPFEKLLNADFDAMFNVNIKSAFFLTQLLVTALAKDAHIINISSMGGFQGSAKFPGLSLYSASKSALAVLTECMAEEFKEKNIKANCLALGAVQTEMLESAFPGYKAPVTATEMAAYIKNFALTGHKFYNGKILPVSVTTP